MSDVKLPPKIRSSLDNYAGRMKKTFGPDLAAVILYGSASSGEFSQKYSNVNLLVVVRDTGLPVIAKAHGLIRSAKFRMMKPVFLTEEYIRTSLDVFPIEFLDMIENHAVLYGTDVLAGLKVDDRNLRFQCEQELKSKLIGIKKRYLETSNRKDLEALLFTAFTSCVHIMRNLLRLKGIKPPYPKEAVIGEYEKAFGADNTVLYEILYAKNKKMALTARDIDALLIGFTKELELISAEADEL